MPNHPLFAVAVSKISRARAEMQRLQNFLDAYDRSDFDDLWSRTAAVAFAVHGAYTGIEDVMTDIVNAIDGALPTGATSHQALLDQMHADREQRRPAVLDDRLYTKLVELKSFRRLVRHQYGIDLDPEKTEAKRRLMSGALVEFESAVGRLATYLEHRSSG